MANKTDEAVRIIANAALGVAVGGQLPPTATLAQLAKAGNGTVQAALRALEDAGAVTFTAHGASGRALVSRDLTALWRASGRGALTGVLPLPESREFAGLATALTLLAEEAGLPFQILFRQGSHTRIKYLQSGRVDFVVLSDHVAGSIADEITSWALGPNSYYADDSVAVITATGRDVDPHGRVPIDRSSSDHAYLTLREFPEAHLVDTPYLFIPELIVRGELDAAIWHQTSSSPLLIATGLALHPLRGPSLHEPEHSVERAAIGWRKTDPGLAPVMAEVFEKPDLERVQREVIDGARIPQF
jgi:hypothetical protein